MLTGQGPSSWRTSTALGEEGFLLAVLDVVEAVGWDCPVGTAVLVLVRDEVVRPVVLMTALRGLAAERAELAGRAAVREALSAPGLRTTAGPWSAVRASVRRAVFTEVLAGFGHVSPRNAWALRAAPASHDLSRVTAPQTASQTASS